MYVSKNLYEKSCTFVDMDDRAFFMMALEQAKSRFRDMEDAGLGTDYLKSHCPIVHISKLSKQTGNEDVVDRRYVHDPARAQRGFLMGDVDFDPGEEAKMVSLVLAIQRFSREHATPYMIYPTLSFPDKPRFRFVFLVKPVVGAASHWKAMKLLYEDLGSEVTDDSDLRINTNRNLPLFDKEEQLGFIQTNFADESLSPFRPTEVWGERWKKAKAPKGASGAAFKPSDPAKHAVELDRVLAVEAARRMKTAPMVRSYSTFWPIVSSMAASVACGGIDEGCAHAMLDAFAEAGESPAQVQAWKSGNRDLFNDTLRRIRSDEDLARVRPLSEWREFVGAVKPPAPALPVNREQPPST